MTAELITARVATLEAPRQVIFRQEQLSADELGARDVLARTIVSAISPGTELAAFSGAPPLRPGNTYPRVVGYCNVAEIIAVGAEVASFRGGDQVLTFASHRSHFRMPAEEVLAALPAGLNPGHAACAYLFHLGYDAVRKAQIGAGDPVIVIGLGALGLGAVAVASISGARVIAVSEHEALRRKAVAFGAECAIGRAALLERLRALGPQRARAVITTSNSWSDWRWALESTGPQGTIAVLGFPGRQESSIPFNPLDSAHFYSRQLRIVAAGLAPERADSRGYLPFNERESIARIFGWMSTGRLRPAELISGAFPPDQLALAYSRLQRREGSPITYLLKWL